MSTTQIIPNPLFGSDGQQILEAAIKRASECMEDSDCDAMGRYPMLWIFSVTTGKDWDQVREDATDRFTHSLTVREKKRFLTVLESDTKAAYRNMCEYFSMFLYCKWTKAGSVRRHKWTSFELALTCPENDNAIRRADFQEQLDDSIAYLDFDIQ